ncbi:MAG: AsmA family protein [Spirochaetes bacterium]|nr:AsmA family protein [Spirochaetota bacterium]
MILSDHELMLTDNLWIAAYFIPKKQEEGSFMKLLLKIIAVLLSIIIILFVAVILLLSIFFPSELVREQIEIQGTRYLQTNLRLEKLDFSIFTGIELKGLTITSPGNSWQNENILYLETARLKYRLWPLLKRRIEVKSCVLKNGKIHLEKIKGAENWRHFIDIFQTDKIEQGPDTKQRKEKKDSQAKITRSVIPVELDLKEIGIDRISLNYLDNTFFDVPLQVSVTELTLLAKNIKAKQNTPFDLESGLAVSIKGGDHITLGAKANAQGQLTIFDEETDEIFLHGPLDLELEEAVFQSKEIKEMFSTLIKGITEKLLGPAVSDMLNDPVIILDEADKHFQQVLDQSEEMIHESIGKANNILAKKKELLDYSTQLNDQYEKKVTESINNFEKKIKDIEGKINPVINTASKIPLIDTLIDLNQYKKKVKSLKNNAAKKKKKFINTYQNQLKKPLISLVNQKIPDKIPDYTDYKQEFLSKVEDYKKEISKNMKKYSLSSFLESYLPDFSFLEKQAQVEKLSTTFYLNKKESEAKEFHFNTEFFTFDGGFIIKEQFLDLNGNVMIPANLLDMDILANNNMETKIKVTGTIPEVKLKIVKMPTLDINQDKVKEMTLSIINKFLAKNYGSHVVMENVLAKFNLQDIDVATVKKQLEQLQAAKLKKLESAGAADIKTIEKEIKKILSDLKGKVPGLN